MKRRTPQHYPRQALINYQIETMEATSSLPIDHPCGKEHAFGMREAEPLIVALDALLAYAKHYAQRYADPLSTDGVLGPYWLQAMKGIRGLLTGQGAIAIRLHISTDTKDNGTCEAMFWAAMKLANFTEQDLDNA